MIDAIIRGGLGEFGTALLDLYLEHAYWINTIVFLYAVALIAAKQGSRKIVAAVKSALMEKFGEDIEKKNENWYKKVLEKNGLDWEEIAHQTWIPIFSTKGALGFQVKKPQQLEKYFTPETIYKALQDQ
jgi:hypothetical protein